MWVLQCLQGSKLLTLPQLIYFPRSFLSFTRLPENSYIPVYVKYTNQVSWKDFGGAERLKSWASILVLSSLSLFYCTRNKFNSQCPFENNYLKVAYFKKFRMLIFEGALKAGLSRSSKILYRSTTRRLKTFHCHQQ